LHVTPGELTIKKRDFLEGEFPNEFVKNILVGRHMKDTTFWGDLTELKSPAISQGPWIYSPRFLTSWKKEGLSSSRLGP
jgi:hypothetical protein